MIATPPPPLAINAISTPGGGTIGMLHCPGRCGGPYGARSLAADFETVEQWGAVILLSLNEAHEFARLGVPTFMSAAGHRRFLWLHAPIPDYATPDAAFLAAWSTAAPKIASALQAGNRVAMHCAAGLGRTGTLAAKFLVDLGTSADAAITQVRTARPGTIETDAQANFVRSSPRLLPA